MRLILTLKNEIDCCHYTNFQPLLAKDNMSKRAKWSETDEIFWNDNIKERNIYKYIYRYNNCLVNNYKSLK
jgi:hypothetical protein